ncbi:MULTISPECIES: tetratricopeptide repeat protein [Duncaniella]|uniref:tetratricopeptide repeat protein n=1 Tax=Duncaniella TaxID=2518495 RepID=UPI0010A3DECC|nr:MULTISPECIES: tetratricopeptide repeat protein [Duncaniella]QCD38862.1 tetratricopeptide repeat protein [Duncaniella sp. C9]QCP72552.1 tetratricopeptide repeat protein [Duncaniella sp. B8]
MKFRTIFSLVLGGFALTAFAQGGYQDGVDYYNADRFEKAKTILEKTLNDPSTDKAVSYFYLGSLDMREGNTAAAAANFNKGKEANPNYGYNYVGLGEIALKNGNKSEASDLFKKALETNKKDASLMAAVARAYFNVDPTLYAKEIDKQIDKAMKVSKNKEAQIYVLQGDMLKTTDVGAAAGRYEQAMVYDEEAGNINPEAYVKYANLYNKVNPDFAIAKLVELNEKLPNSALAQSELAEKYYDGNQFTKAAEQYGKYIQNPNHFQGDEQRYSGLLYFGKKYQESLDVANQVLAKDPNNEYMQRMVMLNKAALKDFTGAEEAAKKLFSHADAKFTATDYTTYGDILGELKRPEDAVAAYTKAYELNPEKNKQILANISSMYTALEDYQKAAEYMQKFVDAGDASLNDYFILSNRYKNLGVSLPEGSPERIEAANNGIKYVDMAIESAANKGPLYRNKATLMMVRDGAEITPALVETYQQMLAAYDENPENKEKYRDAYKSAYNNLANYYLKAGDKEQARAYFEKFLEIDPENEALREYLNKM